ncbi:binding-protein-dependent transport system inner membrane protein [Enterobacter hormaechei]|nr:binding-protein-dependent transport system inner membrane protein [Enterobacter hormaechei]VAF66023.1 binding-protein-dependent transport system inner membrane protein [Enterobacter hormaechei]
MAHDVPLGCAPDEYDDLISGTCSHLPYIYDTAFKYFDMGYGAALAWILFLVVAVFAGIAFKSSKYWVFYSADKGGKNG